MLYQGKDSHASIWAILTLLVVLTTASTAFAHPSPDDIPGVPRHQLGLFLSILAVATAAMIYLFVGLRRSSRARTVKEFFFYDKKVAPFQYFDTTVAYSFQVVITVYFVFWGYKYGIGILFYALTWLAGIFLFQLAAPRLLSFALSNDTLHSFLSKRYGTSLWIRRITASCTFLGLIGALLVEVSYTTDVWSKLSSGPLSHTSWISIFLLLLIFAWLYVQYGGYKATVITDSVQLPVSYACFAVIFSYLIYLGFRAGFSRETFYVAVILLILWILVAVARSAKRSSGARRDAATLVAISSAIVLVVVAVTAAIAYRNDAGTVQDRASFPNLLTLSPMATHSLLVLAAFTILNLSWQFFDMSAWQRISSLNLGGADDAGKLERLKSAIAETKWESPITWSFGIMFGIALRYSGILDSNTQAYDAFAAFVATLFDNDLPGATGMVATYLVLPALIVAFTGIMLSTTDSFLATVTFAWIHDIALADQPRLLDAQVEDSVVLRRAKFASLILLAVAGIVFIVAVRSFNWDILILINVIYSAQFAITFLSLGALFLPKPSQYRTAAVICVVAVLAADLGAAVYCYYKSQQAPQSQWSDLLYVLPTLLAAMTGVVVFGAAILGRAVFVRR